MNLRLNRLLAAGLFVGALLAGLWQAGIIYDARGNVAVIDGGATDADAVSVEAAEVDIETPRTGALSIGLKQGQIAPDFVFSAFDGRRQRLSDYRGRAVFLNFWATWCGPCRYELPDMQTLLAENGGRLAVIAVNNGEDVAPARRYLDGLDLQLTAFAYDPKQDIVKLYGIYGMPMSYFIDTEGVITRVHSGQLSLNVMRSAVAEAIMGSASLGR